MFYSFSGTVLKYTTGESSWYFVLLPVGIAVKIKATSGKNRPGFGSIRVLAKIGQMQWKTSIFPSAKMESYLLPIKAESRKKCDIFEASVVDIGFEILYDLQ
jgi:hypothetical protein